jgi:hypothetical protein
MTNQVPALLREVNRFRGRILADEAVATELLNATYRDAIRALEWEMAQAISRLTDGSDRNEDLLWGQFQADRNEELLRLINREMMRDGHADGQVVTAGQGEIIKASGEEANRLLAVAGGGRNRPAGAGGVPRRAARGRAPRCAE